MQIGELFKDYEKVHNVMNNGRTMLSHQPGEVLCLYFWALENKESREYVKLLQNIFEKNVDW